MTIYVPSNSSTLTLHYNIVHIYCIYYIITIREWYCARGQNRSLNRRHGPFDTAHLQ